MSNFELKTEDSSFAFLNVIYYKGEGMFTITDSTEEYVTVEDFDNLNNKVTFPIKHYVDFARYLRDNEKMYEHTKYLNLPLFHNFIS